MNTPDFGTKLESIKHIGDMVDGKMVCRKDCPSVTHMNTPDTEVWVCKECEQYGEIRQGSVHNIKAMNCRVKPSDPVFFDTNTPDTEVEAFYQHMLKSTPVLNQFERASLKLKVKELLSSRDTYWKEQLQKVQEAKLEEIGLEINNAYHKILELFPRYDPTKDHDLAMALQSIKDKVYSNQSTNKYRIY